MKFNIVDYIDFAVLIGQLKDKKVFYYSLDFLLNT